MALYTTAPVSPRQALIQRLSAQLGLDPNAVNAIGSVEGPSALHGGNSIGDNGTSFGPFQLHAGGALPAEVWARGPAYANAWANSPQGIQYALNRMASVAGGLRGQSAVQAISSRFERPANVPGEVSKAMGFYGIGGGAAPQRSGHTVTNVGQPIQGGGASAFPMLALANEEAAGGQDIGTQSLMALALARQQAGAAQQTYGPQPTTGGLVASPVPPAGGKVGFIGNLQGENPRFVRALSAAAAAVGGTQIRVTSGYRSPQHNAAVGGVPDSNHTTGHAMDGDIFIPGKGWVPLGVALKGIAPRFGLRSGDQPGFFNGGPDPVHVDDGFNLQS